MHSLDFSPFIIKQEWLFFLFSWGCNSGILGISNICEDFLHFEQVDYEYLFEPSIDSLRESLDDDFELEFVSQEVPSLFEIYINRQLMVSVQ